MKNAQNQQLTTAGSTIQDDASFTNRRSDEAVRKAIGKVQAHFFDPSAISNVFATALTEITETTIINEPEEAAIVLSSLRELGIRTTLDDFGTGYFSMTYLQKYAFDILKIDKSFVDDLGTNFDNMRIIKAIIALAQSFALSVTAEGVEFDDHIGILESMGVDSIQGFTIGQPMRLSECLSVWSIQIFTL